MSHPYAEDALETATVELLESLGWAWANGMEEIDGPTAVTGAMTAAALADCAIAWEQLLALAKRDADAAMAVANPALQAEFTRTVTDGVRWLGPQHFAQPMLDVSSIHAKNDVSDADPGATLRVEYFRHQNLTVHEGRNQSSLPVV